MDGSCQRSGDRYSRKGGVRGEIRASSADGDVEKMSQMIQDAKRRREKQRLLKGGSRKCVLTLRGHE